MTTPRVRTNRAPKQAIDIPDRMALIGPGWQAPGRVNMELYVDLREGDGRLLGVTDTGSVLAAYIADANATFSVSWTGELDKPQSWLNAQLALAHSKYAEYRR